MRTPSKAPRVVTYPFSQAGHEHVVVVGPIESAEALVAQYISNGAQVIYRVTDLELDRAQVELRLQPRDLD